jgi:hypothetical protein
MGGSGGGDGQVWAGVGMCSHVWHVWGGATGLAYSAAAAGMGRCRKVLAVLTLAAGVGRGGEEGWQRKREWAGLARCR